MRGRSHCAIGPVCAYPSFLGGSVSTSEKISQLIELQGWNADTLSDLYRDYITYQYDDEALLDYLRQRAEESGSYNALLLAIDDANKNEELDDDQRLELATMLLPGSTIRAVGATELHIAVKDAPVLTEKMALHAAAELLARANDAGTDCEDLRLTLAQIVLPHAEVAEDNSGQLIIYTGNYPDGQKE